MVELLTSLSIPSPPMVLFYPMLSYILKSRFWFFCRRLRARLKCLLWGPRKMDSVNTSFVKPIRANSSEGSCLTNSCSQGETTLDLILWTATLSWMPFNSTDCSPLRLGEPHQCTRHTFIVWAQVCRKSNFFFFDFKLSHWIKSNTRVSISRCRNLLRTFWNYYWSY